MTRYGLRRLPTLVPLLVDRPDGRPRAGCPGPARLGATGRLAVASRSESFAGSIPAASTFPANRDFGLEH